MTGEQLLEVTCVVVEVVFDEAGDEVIAVVIARSYAQNERLAGAITGYLEVIRQQLPLV